MLLMILGLCLGPLSLPASAEERLPTPGIITIPGDRFFPEGVTVAKDGSFYIGSMEEGSIVRAAPGASAADPFIAAGANGLVSVLGLYADDARGILWACSSDAGNGKLTGSAPVAIKAFDLKTGEAKGSYDLPGSGFCNDMTVDSHGHLYVTDSWSPRILRLPAGGSALEEWINNPQLGSEKWSLNGIDFDSANNVIYVVNIFTGQLFRIGIGQDGKAGALTEIALSRKLRRPDGLKVVGQNMLAAAESSSGGMALITIKGDAGEVKTVSEGLDGVATFAFWKGSAWLVENQGQHFWDPDNAGRDAKPPFRLVEIPLGLAPAPVAQPPATLPNTSGGDSGSSIAVLGAALLLMLAGLLLRIRIRRQA